VSLNASGAPEGGSYNWYESAATALQVPDQHTSIICHSVPVEVKDVLRFHSQCTRLRRRTESGPGRDRPV